MKKKQLYYPLGTPGAEEIFSHFKNIEVFSYNVKDYSSIEGKHIDILVANTRLRVNSETIQRFPSVRTFATISTGVDHVNFSDLSAAGKSFINSPGANASSVAEYCMMGIKHFFTENESRRLKVGLVGYGHTARCLGKYLGRAGISFSKFDPKYPDESQSLEEVLSADIVSIHVSLTRDGEYPSWHMIKKADLEKMANCRLLMNTSRGEALDPEAYEAVMGNDKLYKVFDVFSPEPPGEKEIRLALAAKNLLVSPHIAGYSQFGRVYGTWVLANKLFEMYEETRLPAVDTFLKKVPGWQTASFIKEESEMLKRAFAEGDTGYFEKRRNAYPLREDIDISVCQSS